MPRAIVGVVLIMSIMGARAEQATVYQRIVPLESRQGKVTIRTVPSPAVDVPTLCDDKLDCSKQERFGYGVALEFEQLIVKTEPGRPPRPVRERRGEVRIALGLDDSASRTFIEDLRGALEGLGADAFSENWARLSVGKPPLLLLARTGQGASYICFEAENSIREYNASSVIEKKPDGSTSPQVGFSGFDRSPGVEASCRSLESALTGAPGDEIRTPEVVHTVRDQVVQAAWLDIPSRSAGIEPSPLPEGTRLVLRRSPGMISSDSRGGRPDASGAVKSTHGTKNTEYEATLLPVRLPADAFVDRAWVSKWQARAVERTLGALPSENTIGRADLLLGLVPLSHAEIVEGEWGGTPPPDPRWEVPPRVDGRDLVAEVARRLESSVSFDRATLEDALGRRPGGLNRAEWLLVLCRADGTASYELLPTLGTAEVLNSDEICRTMSDRLRPVGLAR